MTAPVQMDYEFGNPRKVMSFLYQNTQVGKTGHAESQVVVTDRPPITVISVALPGDSGEAIVN